MSQTMNAFVENKLKELVELCAMRRVRRLELFGSATNDDFDPAISDLDFLVEFQELTPGEHADAYLGLLDELGDMFEKSIDLLETRAIQNPYFLKNIEKSRVMLYDLA